MNLSNTSTHSSSSLSTFIASVASLKFVKRSKPDIYDVFKGSPGSNRRLRQAHSLDFSTVEHSPILKDLLELHQFDNENKKFESLGVKLRRKSISKKPYNTDEAFHNAVIVGNVELARQIIFTEHIDVNVYRSPGNWTALHHACRLGNLKLVQVLVDAGADLLLLNDEGFSPLRLAVIHGNFDVAMYLIHEKGVSCKEIRDGFQSLLERRNSNTQNDLKQSRTKRSRSFNFD